MSNAVATPDLGEMLWIVTQLAIGLFALGVAVFKVCDGLARIIKWCLLPTPPQTRRSDV